MEQILHEKREHRDRSVEERAEDRDQAATDREVAIFQDAQVDERLARSQLPNDKSDETPRPKSRRTTRS